MARLIALALPGGPEFATELRRIWDAGDAAFPLDIRLPPRAQQSVIEAMAPAEIVDMSGRTTLPDSRSVEAGDALVVATSGSTGAPKGVVLTHSAIRASAAATSERIGVHEHDHWLACLPLSHVGGLSVVTRSLSLGTKLTVLPSFTAEAVTDAARRGGATLVSLVPTALQRIDPAIFRIIVLGGARPPSDRPAHVLATYGMTETGSGVVYDGHALDGVDIAIDADSEVHLSGPMLLRCYRDGRDPKTSDGWLPTGDLGAWLPDGRITILGRRGDLIITGGENVWPETVEAALLDHPDVADCAVVGRDDAEWGQRVTALVVPLDRTTPPSLEMIREHAKSTIPAFAAPRALELVEQIPRTALGKIIRGSL